MLQLSQSLASSPLALDAARVGLRVGLGAFFACTGANKLWCAPIRENVQGLFAKLGVPRPLARAIPAGEFLGGLGLLAGAATPLACAGLVAILGGAIALDTWRADVAGKHPRNCLDWVAKALCEPEAQMILSLAVLAVLGAGRFSLDALAAHLF